MSGVAIDQWRDSFFRIIQEPTTAEPLKTAALSGKLGEWTALLTAAVVGSCEELGWLAAARGHPLDLLPQSGQEYLALDVMAFDESESESRAGHWPLPIAVFELENSPTNDRVAYSLWKVLCIACPLRAVFAYRGDWQQTRELVQTLARDVVEGVSSAHRSSLWGETLLITGSRGEGETFPYGYFKFWKLDANLGQFTKL